MEEILASIRRIISDDQEAKEPSPRPNARSMPAPVAMAPDPEDDVLDLAEIVPVRAVPPAAPPPPAPAPAFSDEDANQIDFDAIEMDDAPLPEPPAPPPPIMAAPAPKAAPEPPRPPERAPEPAPVREERLVSAPTDAAVNQAFGLLAHTVLTNNSRTLEDLVRDMLRPMLKVWLDDNLPSLVERLVRAEIERVARGGR